MSALPKQPPTPPGARDRAGRAALSACVALAAAIALVPGDPRPRGAAEGGSGGVDAPAGAQAAAGAAEGAPPEIGRARIAGRVVDPGGRGIAGATVRATREGVPGDRERASAADDQGRFALEGLPEGRWLVRAGAPGFGESAAVRDVTGAEASGPAGELALTLAPVARIAGQVLGVDGAPAVGAEIVLAGSGVWPARSVRAGGDGRFVLEAVPPGVYEVQARGALGEAPPRRGLEVEAGGRAYLTFHLEPGATMVGSVVDAESGEAIAGAEIAVMEGELGVAPRALRSGADGSFRLSGIRGSGQRVSVHAEGYVPAVGRAWAPGEPLRVALERGAVLSGVVLDARRRPIEGARIEVLGEAGDRQPIALEGAAIAFRAEVFRAHEAVMPASASLGALEVTREVPPIPLVPAVGSASDLAVGAEVAPLGVERATGRVNGRAGAGEVASGFVSGADGSFRIEGVPAGHVQVIARRAGFAPGSSERVWVAPGRERERLEILLSPSGRIEGEVVDARGARVAGAIVEHRSDAEPWPRVTTSDERGRFVLEDVAGAVTVRATAGGSAGVGAAAQVRVDVGAGGRETTRIVLPEAGGALAGRTVDEAGRPVGRAQVRVESMAPGAGAAPRVTFSDDAGYFELEDAPPRPWRVSADHADYAQGEPIDVDEAPGRDGLRVVLREGVSASGRVIDRARGEGVGGAEVVLESLDVPGVIRSARSDAEGAFVIPRARPGRYVARVSADGLVGWRGELAIEASRGGEVELEEIELAAGATLEGDVVDALGHVVRGAAVGIEGDASVEARTDVRGHFVLAGVAAGSIVVRAAHPAAGESTRAVRVLSSRDPAPIVLHLPRRYDPDEAESEGALRRGVAATVEDSDGVVRILAVERGSRAAASGLRPGDVLVAVDGARVESAAHAAHLLRGADGVDAVLDLERASRPFRLRAPRQLWGPDQPP